MRYGSISLLLVIFTLLVSSCEWNKYDEGPLTSVIPAQDRVTNTWFWNLAIENGVNRSGELQDSTIQFTSDRIIKICHTDGGCREGKWGLVSKNTRLNLIFGQEAKAYDILMLKQNEMWLSFSEDGQSTNWELKTSD
ncbi:MAG: hypothetical protein AAFP89_01590 [Bacteroidota bacterium]